MKIISFDDVRSLNISPVCCYDWASEMIADKQKTFLPPKTHMTISDNIFCNVMPCLIHNGNKFMGGVKLVTRYPERKPSLDSKILLFNAESGEFLALMDGNWITAMRTGAVAAHSVMHLAKRNWKTVSMIGLGNVARASMLILLSVLADKKIIVKLLRYKDQAEVFMERFKNYSNVSFQIVDNVEDCIRGSEVIISCATYFKEDIAQDEWFDEGVLVVPVHTRGFMNCDLFFDKVFADDTAHVDHFKYFNEFRYYAEVSDVINGRSAGRENDQERILAYNIGLSIHDINYASHIYQMLQDRPELFKALTDAEMHEPIGKFWL